MGSGGSNGSTWAAVWRALAGAGRVRSGRCAWWSASTLPAGIGAAQPVLRSGLPALSEADHVALRVHDSGDAQIVNLRNQRRWEHDLSTKCLR